MTFASLIFKSWFRRTAQISPVAESASKVRTLVSSKESTRSSPTFEIGACPEKNRTHCNTGVRRFFGVPFRS
jgi:hypothetical protein